MSISEIKSFLEQLPQQITNLQNFIDTFKIGEQSIAQYLNLDVVLSNSTEIAKGIIDKSINFTLGIFGLLTILATLGIIVYFLTNDRDKIKNYCLKLFPQEIRERSSKIIDELETKVGSYVTAQVLCISIVGITVSIILLIMKVEYAVLLGFISAILDLVPIVGPIISGLLILLIAFPKGIRVSIIALSSLFIGQFIENNWAKPYFFSKYMDLHPLVVIFSFVIAAKFLGVVGVLLAPAIAAVVVTLFDEIYIKTMNENKN
jgi:predicted PurR-regulated permease PerM